MYVYINGGKSEPGLYTVGFYKPDGTWEPESDHRNSADAAARVAWLNGSRGPAMDVSDSRMFESRGVGRETH